jgi:hypothetical protein
MTEGNKYLKEKFTSIEEEIAKRHQQIEEKLKKKDSPAEEIKISIKAEEPKAEEINEPEPFQLPAFRGN